MLHFLWCISASCAAMLILQIAIVSILFYSESLHDPRSNFHPSLQFQSQNTNNWIVLVSVIFNLFWTLALIFVPCEIGERMKSEFMKLNFTIGQFDWYSFSYVSQKILPVIIINAQQPVSIEWFGSLSCVREVFKKVCHSINYRDRIHSITYLFS